MATLRMLPDTVVLANFIGEVNDVATYQYTTLKHVYCPTDDGVAVSSPGRRENDTASLFIFHHRSVAVDSDGNVRQYIRHDLWNALPDKSGFWTLDDGGRDTFRKLGHTKNFTVKGFSELKAGSRRMWHFEVNGV